MSAEISLLQINSSIPQDIESFLIEWDEEYEDGDPNSFDILGGFVEILHYLLIGSPNTAKAWFNPSNSTATTPLVEEVWIPDYGATLLVNCLAAGVWLSSLSQSHSIVASFLTNSQVQEIAEALSRIRHEDLESRWNNLHKLNRGQQENSKALRDVVAIKEFSEFFINRFVAFYVEAARANNAIIVVDCT
jgi:Domain of unknown function (DUF1877)